MKLGFRGGRRPAVLIPDAHVQRRPIRIQRLVVAGRFTPPWPRPRFSGLEPRREGGSDKWARPELAQLGKGALGRISLIFFLKIMK